MTRYRPILPRAALLLLATGCVANARPAASFTEAPPAWMVGSFEDDYGSRHTITAKAWTQERYATYTVVRWNAKGEYLIARNDVRNPADGGMWTRIDWMRLPGMPPYEWGYCIGTWNAATQEEAEAASTIARRGTPRTGCGGHPFTRMKRASVG